MAWNGSQGALILIDQQRCMQALGTAQRNNHDAETLIAALGEEDLVIVDIRDVRERAKGHIPGSFHAPRGMVEFWVDPV